MSYFKTDATIAFLSLFPRSRRTKMRENLGNVLKNSQFMHLWLYTILYIVMYSHDLTNLRAHHSLFVQEAHDLKDSHMF